MNRVFISTFDVHVTVHRDKFLIINQLDALNSQINFCNETLPMCSGSLSPRHGASSGCG